MSDVFYNKTITIYNRVVDDDLLGAETWYPTVLENSVHVLSGAARSSGTTGQSEANNARVYIRTDNLVKKYLSPKKWSKTEDKIGSFTLASGVDFFVIGDTSDEDCSIENFYEHMRENYDDVYRVVGVDKYDLIPHLEVSGV